MNKLESVTKILLAVWLLATPFGAKTPQLLDPESPTSETPSQDGTSKSQPSTPTSVMVQDFESVSAPPTVGVVNIPIENASVQL
jgi:hypothetical protein